MRIISPEKISPPKALSIFIKANLTKIQYNVIRKGTKESICQIFPKYKHVKSAKIECYPENITISEER